MVPPPPPPRIDGSPTHPALENMLKPRRGGGQHLPLSRRSLVFILLFFSLLMAGTFSRPLVDEVRRISCCPGALKWIEFEGKWKEGWFHLCFVPMRLLDEALGGSPVEAKKKNCSFIGVSSISFPGHPNGEDRSGSGPGFNWAGPSLESGECWLWHGIQFLIPFLYFFFCFLFELFTSSFEAIKHNRRLFSWLQRSSYWDRPLRCWLQFLPTGPFDYRLASTDLFRSSFTLRSSALKLMFH